MKKKKTFTFKVETLVQVEYDWVTQTTLSPNFILKKIEQFSVPNMIPKII